MPEPEENTETTSHQPHELIEVDDELMLDIEDLVRSKSDFLLLNIIQDVYPADIAHIMNGLENEQAEYVFGLLPDDVAGETMLSLDQVQREHILGRLDRARLQQIVSKMASDDAADIVGELSREKAQDLLETLGVKESSRVEELLHYDESTAGGIMGKELAAVNQKDTLKKAIKEVREFAKTHKNVYSVYIVDDNGILMGLIPLQDLLIHAPNRRVHKIMSRDIISVTTDVDQEEVARVFKKYGVVAIPVTDKAGKLLGRITVDDIVDVIEEEHDEDVARMTGSEVVELEKRSPAQIAFMRLPWVLITLVLEMFAGVVVHQFDKTLSQVILLASFMPIISAISGNTGLQSAAVIVRGIATGHIDVKRWWPPIWRQFQTTLIIGAVCGTAIGVVGAVWHAKAVFGFVVGISMFLSVNISGVVGTATPMVSHRLGFDPAITAGPFETAFQDVVGITIFLSIATLLLQWL